MWVNSAKIREGLGVYNIISGGKSEKLWITKKKRWCWQLLPQPQGKNVVKNINWANNLIPNNNIRSIILEIKMTNVKSLKY